MKARIEMEDPNATECTTLKPVLSLGLLYPASSEKRVKPITEIVDPILVYCLVDTAEPKAQKSNTEVALPCRANDLTDMALAKCWRPRIDAESFTAASRKNTEREEPALIKARKDNEELMH
jgi:hypothetical protein